MAWIRLVADELEQAMCADGQVRVDPDQRLQLSEVVGVPGVRLAGDQLPLDRFAIRQAEALPAETTHLPSQKVDTGLQLIHRDQLVGAPRAIPLPDVTFAR
jgi:hypothetical protein